MSPHPQSRASLDALHAQLRAESYDRAGVYDRMANKIWTDWQIQRVLSSTRCFAECMPEHFAARSKIQVTTLISDVVSVREDDPSLGAVLLRNRRGDNPG